MRSRELMLAAGISFGLGVMPAAGKVITASVGVMPTDEDCGTFKMDDNHAVLKSGDALDLHVVNNCTVPWEIKVDRVPDDSFSSKCRSENFTFETYDTFAPGEDRVVKCGVQSDDKPRHSGLPATPSYRFEVSGRRPTTPTPTPTPTPNAKDSHPRPRPFTHTLEVEVDP
jgi:hypothetical protein